MPRNVSELLFVGFSIHCGARRCFERVLANVQVSADQSGYSYTVFSDFIYLKPKSLLSQNAFDLLAQAARVVSPIGRVGEILLVGRLTVLVVPAEPNTFVVSVDARC